MAEYIISGTLRMGGRTQKFAKTIEAKTENHAIHLVKSILGSKHKTKSHLIKINKIEMKK